MKKAKRVAHIAATKNIAAKRVAHIADVRVIRV